MKKKTADFKAKKEYININQPIPVVTRHQHTVQTVFVPTPPQIIVQQSIVRQNIVNRKHYQSFQVSSRSESVPKIRINYVSPTNRESNNLHTFLGSNRN